MFLLNVKIELYTNRRYNSLNKSLLFKYYKIYNFFLAFCAANSSIISFQSILFSTLFSIDIRAKEDIFSLDNDCWSLVVLHSLQNYDMDTKSLKVISTLGNE